MKKQITLKKNRHLILGAALMTYLVPLASGAVVVTGQSVIGTDIGFAAAASATDLINQGASTFSSVVFSETPGFGPAENDGVVGPSGVGGITFFSNAAPGEVFTITYTLDTSVNTLGYDITELQTINGFTTNSGNQKNQNYTVDVSTTADASFSNVATVAFLPFGNGQINGTTIVNVTEDTTGILASGVDQIRFTYTVPASGGNSPGPTIREIDVFGSATVVPEPSSAALLALGCAGFALRRRRN